MGVVLKSYLPKMWVYADIFGFNREDRNIFKFMTACVSSRPQCTTGNYISTVDNPALKWSLNV